MSDLLEKSYSILNDSLQACTSTESLCSEVPRRKTMLYAVHLYIQITMLLEDRQKKNKVNTSELRNMLWDLLNKRWWSFSFSQILLKWNTFKNTQSFPACRESWDRCSLRDTPHGSGVPQTVICLGFLRDNLFFFYSITSGNLGEWSEHYHILHTVPETDQCTICGQNERQIMTDIYLRLSGTHHYSIFDNGSSNRLKHLR